MSYFKDTNNNLHFLDDDSFDYLLPEGCIKLTDSEAEALINPQPTIEQIRAEMRPLNRVQFKTVMLKHNLWNQALTLAESVGVEAQVKLSDGQVFERLDDTLNMMAGKLALSDGQVDAMFNEAYGY